MRILPIVEGPGDVDSVPLLLRRLLHERHNVFDVEIARQYRYGENGKVTRNFSRQALAAAKEGVPLLWTLDCDDGCPVEWANHFEQIIPAGITVPIKFAFFQREYECMFLAEHDCLVAELAINPATPRSSHPENIRGAKERISKMMPAGAAYKETVHQARLTARMDLNNALANSRSLRHLESSVLSLVQSV